MDDLFKIVIFLFIADDLEEEDGESKQQSKDPDTSSDQHMLYQGASVTIGAAMLLLAVFVVEYNLTSEATQHLLQMMSVVLPAGNLLPQSLGRFRKFFLHLRNPVTKHFFCSVCLTYLTSTDVVVCPNSMCSQDLSQKDAKSYFIEIPVVSQLKTLFRRPGFYSSLQHRFIRRKQHPDNIEDIYDGELYKSLSTSGVLTRDDISFVLNTDGVPVFKSSKVSIWPVFVVINELPLKARMTNENVMLCGLWFGEKKPSMCTFLKPFHHSFKLKNWSVE